ncbi:hypothetical protein FKW77_001018 [Venturia effusa]|uniref:Uncharacterized protein n=1 Tax=Venturia effusa TaxID=50376 RepID=A0A517LPG1_9PEZI|nr:hypothetical protein FKW77_001018 [Venturia effusa]
MAPLPQCPQSPLPEARGNLTFGRTGLMVNGEIAIATSSQLRAMLSIPCGLRAPAVTERWIRGQLDLYSIPYNVQSSALQLSGVLENAVRDGSCDNLPQNVEDVLRDMENSYRAKVGTAFRELRSWCSRNPEDADILFEHLMSPSMEAYFDLERFLDRHFPEVEADDRLQQSRDKKTHWAIALPCYRPKDTLMLKRIKERRMQYTVSGYGKASTYILAWETGPLNRLRNKCNEHEYRRLLREKETVMKQLHAQHVDYCSTQALNNPTNNLSRLACDLLRPVGHWVVRCDAIVSRFDITAVMTLDVHDLRHAPPLLESTKTQVPLSQRPIEECGILAAFDFGILRGTMALSVDAFILAPFRRVQYSFDDAPCFHKRLYFEWAGHSQRGKLQRADHLAMTGYLDFDEDYTVFKGVFQTDAFGDELVIRGYKISDTPPPGTIPMPLASYVKDDDEGSEDMDLARSSDDEQDKPKTLVHEQPMTDGVDASVSSEVQAQAGAVESSLEIQMMDDEQPTADESGVSGSPEGQSGTVVEYPEDVIDWDDE